MYKDIKQIYSLRFNYHSIPGGNLITLPPFPKQTFIANQKTNEVSRNVCSRCNYVIENSKELIMVDSWHYELTIDDILKCENKERSKSVCVIGVAPLNYCMQTTVNTRLLS